jgi:hypothetical protein
VKIKPHCESAVGLFLASADRGSRDGVHVIQFSPSEHAAAARLALVLAKPRMRLMGAVATIGRERCMQAPDDCSRGA